MAAGIDRHRRKPVDAAPQGPIRYAVQNSAAEGLIDSSDEIGRVLLDVTSITGPMAKLLVRTVLLIKIESNLPRVKCLPYGHAY
jgi:hypothetical protein